eukprot:CAMPEP_0172678190 /NCGR_PEP_ID=MMETSP1074-20121228/15215_1 /TAXON_ID=2916 /ORGANISM="Ceratium fusus, Strain PA161109" /LENGTH=61 /DNA_ID=CAMNT_0013496163 /DNA_START=389 /DNA_END=571 /DNA_ORIENTATION=-
MANDIKYAQDAESGQRKPDYAAEDLDTNRVLCHKGRYVHHTMPSSNRAHPCTLGTCRSKAS